MKNDYKELATALVMTLQGQPEDQWRLTLPGGRRNEFEELVSKVIVASQCRLRWCKQLEVTFEEHGAKLGYLSFESGSGFLPDLIPNVLFSNDFRFVADVTIAQLAGSPVALYLFSAVFQRCRASGLVSNYWLRRFDDVALGQSCVRV